MTNSTGGAASRAAPRTITDLASDAVASGYEGVSYAPDGGRSKKPYHAQKRVAPGDIAGTRWSGPRRATPEEAAQDYLDYLANGTVRKPLPNRSTRSGRRERLPRTPEVVAALGVLADVRGQQDGNQGYIYLIGEVYPPGYRAPFAKIGYSTKPEARVGELQAGNPRQLRLIATVEGTLADEKALHEKYDSLQHLDEWFWLTDDLLAEFTDVAE